jgi:iron complex transport system ATP-binding protein
MLQGENISIGYSEENILVRDINFHVQEGQLISLLGVNGIGKSTLLKTLAGLHVPLHGSILLDTADLTLLQPLERARKVSAVFTARNFGENIVVNELVSLGRYPYTNWLGKLTTNDLKIVDEIFCCLQIEHLRGKGFNRISDGEKQKVLIARALCQQTPLMILDEPTAFLDFRNKEDIIALLKSIAESMKKIIIFSTHDLEAATCYSHKFWILNERREFSEVENRGDSKQLKALLSVG